MNTYLEAQGIIAGYAAAPVLRDVSLSVSPGQAVGLMGANGAGKTSLLRVLMGELRPTQGEVTVRGSDVTRRPAWWRARRGIAHVPEGRRLFASLTVEENLRVGALAGTGTSLQAAYDLFPKLHDRRYQRAGTLSGGEQQMVAISRALVSQPQVILIDELSAGLAPVIAQQLVEALVAIKQRGVGLVIVEQAPALIKDAIDDVVVLTRGSVAHRGPAKDLQHEQLRDLYLGVGRGLSDHTKGTCT